MIPGTYEVRSLEHPGVVTVELEGYPAGRLVREAIVAFIADYWVVRGWAPTTREIAEGVGLRSTGSVHGHLALLAAAGRVRFEPSTPRSLRVVR